MLKLQPLQQLYGTVFYSDKTKELVQSIPSQCFALLDHRDIDEMAALSLINKQVKAVLNYSPSMSGEYPSKGTVTLTEAKIPVFDINEALQVREVMKQGDIVKIEDNGLWRKSNHRFELLSLLTPYTPEFIQYKLALAESNHLNSLEQFTENTLEHAQRELREILKPIAIPSMKVSIEDRHVIVVTRGSGYMEDLMAIKGYIQSKNPLFIGVDGGADAILRCGYIPDIIFGDMDSVSKEALFSGAEIVVHAYANGYAPGLERVKRYHLQAHTFPCFGTSEDAAHLLAYEAGAVLIVTLGSHTNMVDFLAKGRKGMGSTLLVRLKIGEKLVDATGVRRLWNL